MPFDGDVAYVVNRATETNAPLDLAEALYRYGDCSVDVLSYYGTGDYSGDLVDVQPVGKPSRLDPTGYASLRTAIEDYDLVQIHHNFSGLLCRVLASVDGPPVVSRVGNVRHGFSPIARNLQSLTNPLCDQIVCNSEAVYESLTEWEKALCGRDRYRVIPRGFDETGVAANLATDPGVPFDEVIDDVDVVVSTASIMTEQKDLRTLLLGIATLTEAQRRDLTVLLAGDGPRREALEALVHDLGLEDTVEFLGLLDRRQVHHLLDRTDVFAMPSKWEGFSGASLEAMGIGTACLFSDIDPFRGPYDGRALFHEPTDYTDLGSKLALLIEDDQRRTSLAEDAREHVLENYHVAAAVQEYLDLYRELVRN